MIDQSMQPLMPSDGNAELQELATQLVMGARTLCGQIGAPIDQSVGDLVRSMNCYYSNLIEGHDTHPLAIDAALKKDYDNDERQRDLQLEARAHIQVQQMIDHGDDPDDDPTSIAYLRWLHLEFCSRLPESMLIVTDPQTNESLPVIPGEFRKGPVQVGRHVPPDAQHVVDLLARFEQTYASQLTTINRIIAAAAAHHRLLWIHPFYDGNGRVARLMSHAMLLRSDVGCSLWSVSRGLARHAEKYKQGLANADRIREGALDGRGALSERQLVNFCTFFLDACVDQVQFMESLLKPTELWRRIELYVQDEVAAKRLPSRSMPIMREVFLAGEMPRVKAAQVTGYKERAARQVLAALLEKQLLVADGIRAPVRLGFPIDVVERWFPRLYPGIG